MKKKKDTNFLDVRLPHENTELRRQKISSAIRMQEQKFYPLVVACSFNLK